MTEFNGYLLTEKEAIALTDLLKEMREKEEHDALIKQCKESISLSISKAIEKIGLADTKHIVRELARDLRK